MATKRRPLHPNRKFNFRPNTDNFRLTTETPQCETKGKKPLPDPSSVKQVLLIMVMHVCRKSMFVDTSVKVGIYGGSLFLVSFLADVLPMPRTYFARSDNLFNQYFVKFGWGWTLCLTVPFVVLSSHTYCCGKREKIAQHVVRLGIATAAWYFWTKLFNYVENNYGRCNVVDKRFQSKEACLEGGFFWHGFDISGHAFILIYSSLIIIEECRAINGWDGIKDMIRNETHLRSSRETAPGSSPLRSLTNEEFTLLQLSYEKFTPYIRSLFIAMTILSVLWDVMLISTMLYYHIMIEKFISGAVAILTWFVTYRFWYAKPNVLPNLPGEGLFKYRDTRQSRAPSFKRKPTVNKGEIPKFMGMPLYGLKKQDTKEDDDENCENDPITTSLRV
ncbi:hypothetical protein PR048_001025 [Dryococelus australis]|uniref:Uncharacterized protein n=1 Tax=Dryococelus australis TaxID=614101 RepID=A0ABQ9IHI6_9NEOP|nr:hypothetical protein PR048_001025 [Dryococelus australis]